MGNRSRKGDARRERDMPGTLNNLSSVEEQRETDQEEVLVTAVSRLSSKGQVTVPIEIRRLLNAEEGDRIIFKATSRGVTLEVEKQTDLMDLFGVLQDSVVAPFDLDEARRAMRETVAEKVTREGMDG
jgi:antitoxin PrlF